MHTHTHTYLLGFYQFLIYFIVDVVAAIGHITVMLLLSCVLYLLLLKYDNFPPWGINKVFSILFF